jgi:two-component system cell cycle response regulator
VNAAPPEAVRPTPQERELQRQIASLIERGRENERRMRRFQETELRIIGATGLRELVEAVLIHHRRQFRLDAVSLILVDPEYELRRALENARIPASEFPDLLFLQDDLRLGAIYGGAPRPVLGACDPARHGFFFPRGLPFPQKAALLPLARAGRLIGSLNLGSNEPARFEPGTATDFLERLAMIVAVCLENVCNAERLKTVGLTDPLTGVHNRRYFDERLREETVLGLRRGSPLACLLLDVDHFKRVNDSFGHQVGDWVLRETAGRIKRQLRLSDSLARYGGEEFVALLAQTSGRAAAAIAERIRASVAEQPFELAEYGPVRVTLSVGIGTLDGERGADPATAAAAMVAAADRALYRAKESGRNRVVSGT